MKTTIKIFVCAVIVSIVFLSCSEPVCEEQCGPSEPSSNSNTLPSNSDTQSSSSNAQLSSSNLYNSSSSSGEYACNSNNEMPITKIPNMDNRVIFYQRAAPTASCIMAVSEALYAKKVIIDKDILNSCFPNIFDNEQINECSYFAIPFMGSRHAYYVLSQDMALYSIKSDISGVGDEKLICRGGHGGMDYDLMLVCDDEIGTLKKCIDLDNVQSYTDPDWDCETENVFTKDVFF
ncbi:MAG: hypothetical protein LBC85_04615 [Fibromonadaceae bacterium]|jgi:hypothetical protein|nr:hypothetical protein [Fibromonadaceae bacterium]